MSEQEIDDWMLATDEERAAVMSKWNVNAGDGKQVADAVAALFQKECVYNVDDVSIILDDEQWKILALASVDYDNLKDRNIDFLGFRIVFDRKS